MGQPPVTRPSSFQTNDPPLWKISLFEHVAQQIHDMELAIGKSNTLKKLHWLMLHKGLLQLGGRSFLAFITVEVICLY